jgi:hypothetical protein
MNTDRIIRIIGGHGVVDPRGDPDRFGKHGLRIARYKGLWAPRAGRSRATAGDGAAGS